MDRETRHKIKHDRFVDEVAHFYQDVRKNSQKVIIGVVGLLVLIGIGFGIRGYSSGQEEAAQTKLADAIEILSEPVGETALPDGEMPKYKTDAEKLAAAEPAFKAVIEESGGSDAASVANLYIAQIELGRGEVEPALAKFEEFVRKNRNHILAGTAQMSVYELKLAASPESVIPELETAVDAPKTTVPKASLMMLLAEAYEKAGETEKSLEMYRRLATEHPDSLYAAEAQEKTSSS